MDLRAVELVEHLRRGDDENALLGLACGVGEGAGEEGFPGPGLAEEQAWPGVTKPVRR